MTEDHTGVNEARLAKMSSYCTALWDLQLLPVISVLFCWKSLDHDREVEGGRQAEKEKELNVMEEPQGKATHREKMAEIHV